MSSKTWNDEAFDEQYRMLKVFFVALLSMNLILSIGLAGLYSIEAGFNSNSLLLNLALIVSIAFFNFFQGISGSIKRVYYILFYEAASLLIRCLSARVTTEDKMLCCILATMVELFFQSNVFSSQYSVMFLMTKHVVIWHYISFENYSLIDLYQINSNTILVTITIIMFSYIFERNKIKIFKAKNQAIESSQSAQSQLLYFLQVFPYGLTVFEKNFKLRFNNNAMVEIQNDYSSLKEFLNSVIEVHSKTTGLNLVENYLKSEEITELSLGIFALKNKSYEFHVHKIHWETEECCMLTVHDISKIQESERLQAEKKCQSQIIRSLSHEFRTPINCVSLILEELYPHLHQSLHEKINNAQSCLKLLSFQLNDILDNSDLETNKFTSIKSETILKTELQSLINLIKTQADYKKVKVFSSIDPNLPDSIKIDWYRIQKIIVNLLTNALKYTYKGFIELFAKCKGKYLTIGVKDTGIGIPPERLSQICKMFSDNSNFSLSGLGLNISQKILAQFNSKLQIKSDHGKGSVFKFDLIIPIMKANSACECISEPLTDGEIPSENLSKSLNRISSCLIFEDKSPQVLVVDDTEFSRMCIGNMLKGELIEFVEACNGQEAVDLVVYYDKIGSKFDCIIMDCNMPVMDGWEACLQLKQMFSQGHISYFPNIIGYTAFNQESDISKCFGVGMVTYINKPSSKEKIISVVQQYIRTLY